MEVCNKIMLYYEMILEQGNCHDVIILDLYISLLSGKSDIFSGVIICIKDDKEVRANPYHDSLATSSVNTYNNMVN